ncbi:elongation factor G [Micromonospora tarensis]|uniref:TetM/TetW/TetO/TetS family tetracycline resistance ribosomal protection protein n=1 Tax=Micromonospora tarensis TaxID=2806100 RepID=A0ABS1YDD4_9ACTN|nr:TetM/TetW/TetO/TetS family tetracycline resistance ribosomal protection protein [Micromonospora tarensis]MBM0275419.1 TetM/TetW/TetO/TetS family tetracycline resistance ribosomal protection protein [Micromonospora tarensis]
MNFVNVGIVAHVDAGKTSLTERLLFNAGLIPHIGSVDRGDTQTDSHELERRRGITIKSAVVSFRVNDVHVNLVDTPGHSDFVAEVERALRMLDAAVLVISAVEGVQARTRVLMRRLVRMRIPTLIFVNKIDRMGARDADLVDSIREHLTPDCVVVSAVEAIGTRAARSRPRDPADPAFTEELAEVLGAHDESFLDAYLDDGVQLSARDCLRQLSRQVRAALVYPVHFGSAVTGEGVDQLTDALSTMTAPSPAGADAPLKATVFKLERGRAGEKIAYVRTFAGSLRARDRVRIYRGERGGGIREFGGRLSAVRVFDRGADAHEGVALPGAMAKVSGLPEARIGDQLGSAEGLLTDPLFAPPGMEAIVSARHPGQRAVLFAALQQLSEQDPVINVRRDELDGTVSVDLYGEVQKEVLAATLAEEFGIEVEFAPSRPLYVERLVGSGEALEEIGLDGPNFFWATVGLRLEPAAPGTGTTFQLAVELGSLPLAFHKAIEETVHQTLRYGLYGWSVIDCAVTLTRTGYASPISAAGDFRSATPLVVGDALKRAGTRVYEPVHRFSLEAPADAVGALLATLNAVQAIPDEHRVRGARTVVLGGVVPADQVDALAQRLPEVTSGEGVLLTEFDGYRPFAGPAPVRRHPGASPYDREKYMLHALGRVS